MPGTDARKADARTAGARTAEAWNVWRARRDKRLRLPHGTLSLVGTHWLEAEPAPIVPGEPVLWSGDEKTVTVTAKAEHGLIFEGAPIDGTVTLYPDTAEHPSTVTVPDGDLLLEPIEREGVPALRVYDPNAETLRDFDGVDIFDFAPDAVVEGVFTPYPEQRTEQVLNADGKHRGIGLVGEVAFALSDGPHTFAVERNPSGTLQAVLADGTSGKSTYRFRFLTMPEPDADGATTVDFNRAYLPPCAFTDFYVCPVPPAGNTLTLPIEAGEKAVRWRR
ncbi:MAG: DUF1684 domain-containing protein [Actinocrinis sp.]